MTLLAMSDTGTSRGHLEVSTPHDLGVSHRITAEHGSRLVSRRTSADTGGIHALFKFSIDDVRKYFEFFVGMGAKPGAGLDSILVEDTQLAETHVILVTISIHDGLKLAPTSLIR